MPSDYDAQYSELHSLLEKLKPIFVATDDEITNLLSASSTAEISNFTALINKSIDASHSIMDDYREIVETITSNIDKMDDQTKKDFENNEFNAKMDMSNGNGALPFNPVSLTSTIAKMETRFARATNSATMRVIALSRCSTPAASSPSISSPNSGAQTVDGSSIIPSSLSTTDTSVLQSLLQRVLDSSSSPPAHTPNLSLPPIKLETYDGSDITRWPSFKYQLDELILNQEHLNEVEKAYYVRTSLKGDALNLVSTIPVQKNFLAKIVERLELEYGRSNLTQATLLQSLLRIRSKSTKLEDQIHTVRKMINLVHTIDKECGLDGLLTQQQLADRIHPRFIGVVWKHKPATLLDALQLIEETLRSELEEVTITSAISERSHHSQNTVGPFPNYSNKSNKPASAADSNFPSPKGNIPRCVFCGQHAYSGECTIVKSSKDRKDILKKKSLCFCCFSSKHSSADCSKKCSNCSGKHHKAVCEKPIPLSNSALAVHSNQPERLFTVKAKVANPVADRVVPAHIHLDHGAQATLITRDLVNRLSLVPFDRREMTISGINGDNACSSIYDIVNVVVVTDRGHYPIEAVVLESSSVNSIHSLPLSEADLAVIKATLGNIPKHFSKSNVVYTDLFLSVGDTLELLENAKETKLPCGYRLVQSSIGPLVVGSSKPRICPIDPQVSALTIHSDIDDSLEKKIERLFSVDPAAREYETTEKEARKATNELVNRHFEDTIEKQGDEYFVQYAIKPEAKTDLPTNYDLAASRLNSTIRTLSKNRSNLEFYDSIIEDQLSLGQIEKVNPSDNDGIIHYLAHQPVLRPDKPTTPLRIVYDASAHLKNSPSLNDMIHPGPSDLEMIPALLLRARSRRTLIVADVEKAFLQVKLHPSQRNMLRFLWVKDLNKPVTHPNILVLRFCVTPFGVNASPALLNKVIHHHIKMNGGDCDPRLIHQLVSNLYVDNVIINVDDPCPIMYTQSKKLFETMSMNLRDYASNNIDFNLLVPESDRSKDEVQKLLGLLWNSTTDKLSIKIPVSNKNGKVSKRTMLSNASSPYDPLGLLNPLILPARLTIQNLWNTPLKWDDPVDDTTRDTFHEQMRELEEFSLEIDRFSHLSDSDEINLIAFSDASKVAMATCVYSWSTTSPPTLLISKSRLAPIKCKSTIPKMELDSLVMSHILIRFTVDTLRKEFPEKPIHLYFYSDSAVVLHWCKPEFSKPLGVFVSNRIKKIHETREELSVVPSVFYHHPRHVRSEDNPADHATRGLTAKEMNNPLHQWWTGPEWMTNSPNSWPDEDLSSLQCPNFESFPINISAVVVKPTIETVIDLSRFSCLHKAIIATASVYRFLSRCALKTKNPRIIEKLSHLPESSSPRLSSAEKRFAFNSIIRLHQSLNVHHYDSLKKSKSIAEDPSTKLWKSNTRLMKSHLNSEAKSPVFIPTLVDSTLARLIILEIHQSSSHSNIDIILNQVKGRYWIPRCRQIAKSVLRQCVPCRKTNNLPFRYPPSPVLPHDRVRQSLPFEHCGIDYAGPFHSNNDEKMYIVVITCFSTRLSHLEVVDSLLPSSFILAFKRFCARRGTPVQITSHKATTFKMSSTLFIRPEECPEVNTLMSNLGINWNFTTAHSPWKGGIYERLIKIIKDSLSRSIGRKRLSKDEFITIVCEIEALLNSRPLTYVSSDDVQSFNRPALRPIDLLSPNSFLGCPIILSESDGDYRPPEEDNSSREAAIKQLKRSIDTVEAFWKRWNNEYLTTLRDCSSKSDPLHASRSTTIAPIVGSLVIVVDESGTTPRSTWKMAKILSLTENSATLRSHAGRIIERPLNLLIPLEICSSDTTPPESIPTADNNPLNNHPMKTRSKNDAAEFHPDHDYQLKSYESFQNEDLTKSKEPTLVPAPRKSKKPTASQLSKDISNAILPEISATISSHLIDYIPDVAEAVSAKITPDINQTISDALTVITNQIVDLRSTVYQLSTTVSTLSSIVRAPSTAPTRSDFNRDNNRTPSISHHHSHRIDPHPRSRSPIQLTHRNRSRSRSPMRPIAKPVSSQQKKLPQCALCKGTNHLSRNCEVTTSLSSRLAIMRNENRCKNCFRVLDQSHFPTCEPPLCHRGCTDRSGRLERHAEPFCPRNPKLTR